MTKFFVLGFFSLLLFTGIPSAFAQTEDATQSASTANIPTADEYILPFPGLLPDNPFYFLKTSRDRVISFLITDPLKKAEFNLLQADKRLSAGVVIFKNGKKELAEETISKGENYFEEAVVEIRRAKGQGMDAQPLIGKLHLSSIKHQSVIESLKKETKGELSKKFENLLDRMATVRKDVMQLEKQK